MRLEFDDMAGGYTLKNVPKEVEKDLALLGWWKQGNDWLHDDEEKVEATVVAIPKIDLGDVVL